MIPVGSFYRPLRNGIYVGVCGGRDNPNWSPVFRALDTVYEGSGKQICLLITGGCPTGSDLYAESWARDKGIVVAKYLAPFEFHGPPAGPMRIEVMIEAIAWERQRDFWLAFRGNSGTKRTIEKARAWGLKVYEVDQ